MTTRLDKEFEGLSCSNAMALAMTLEYRSPHHKKPCWMCKEDASEYNHCSWCGKTFSSYAELAQHLK